MITQCDIDVRYPDCDAMGIVHHAVYPIWYEIARMDFFEKMGFAYPDMHALGVDPRMTRARAPSGEIRTAWISPALSDSTPTLKAPSAPPPTLSHEAEVAGPHTHP